MKMTIREALKKASRFLEEKGIEDALFLAEYTIRYVTGWDRTRLFSSMSDTLSEDKWKSIESILQRRSAGEPIQYIVGEQEFYGIGFKVNSSVLIPRPETEQLVEEIIKQAHRLWPNEAALSVADIGTGSGAIVVTLAVEGGVNWTFTATDIAMDSLAVAEENAARHGVREKISFVAGDLLQPLLLKEERVHILVSNPPYIPSSDIAGLDLQVKEHEPNRALDGGEDGLDFYRRMVGDLPRVLENRALVGWEVGIHQAETVQHWLKETGLFERIYIVKDLAGIARHVIAVRDKK
ncbi:peptide chain release factor N(5)-glutamine methyltransferase [Aneurinibacillus terranovensis]|uniref:peptide chain release factor N(5)-glutamine methyltransferase n=1 Tax=Aneurinibacillus terranovensis TaxID=278991 RepID=UPI000410F537|nr:peptide chain release factor N(5)-glutamine methyltransferase [Aneurinibacillus terranovensis]